MKKFEAIAIEVFIDKSLLIGNEVANSKHPANVDRQSQ